MRCIIPIGCLKQSQAVPWKGLGVSRQVDIPSPLYCMALMMPGDTLGSCAHAEIPATHLILWHPELWGPCRCRWDRTCFPDPSCLPAGCARGAFAASSPKCPQVCTNPEQPHGALFSSAPTAPTFGFPCPGSACPAQASPSPSALLSALQAGFHFRAVLCVSPAGGDRQTGWVTGQSRAVQSNFQAGWAWGTLLMGSCRTEAFPAFTTQFRLVKKIISFLASVCQGEIKNLPRLVPGLRACPALTPLRMALLTLFGFRLLLWHLLTRVSWRFPCMELCGVAVGQEGEKGWVGAPCVPFPTSPIHLEAQQGPAEPRFPALK